MTIQKSGMVSLVGRPNVGKSTLMNTLLGYKVSIVSDKPQTTRHRLCAVLNQGDTQVVLMDTPGFHRSQNKLGDYMVRVVRESVTDVDAVVLMVEPVPRVGTPETMLIERLHQAKRPAILVINKVDTVKKDSLLAVIDAYQKVFSFSAIVPMSAKEGDGTELLFDELKPFLPEGPALYPEGQTTDQPERALIAESVREKLLNHLDKEVPHGTAVVVEKLHERENGLVEIGVVIVCEKASHKGILIGKNGAMLKTIGQEMRTELEELYEGPVLFRSWVKIKEDWRDRPGLLHELGFDL